MIRPLRSHLNWLAFTAALFLAHSAQAGAPGCSSDSISLATTTWNQRVTIPKFDAALGDLTGIQFTLSAHATGSAAAESLDGSPSTVTMQFQTTLTLTRPDNSVIVVAVPLANFMDALTTFDGTVDFGGTSGVSHPNLSASDAQTVNSNTLADLALFTGPANNPGRITLPVSAAGTSTASGAGNLITQFTSFAECTVTVCYSFSPNSSPVFTSTDCGTTMMASVGVALTFQVCASDSNPADVVMISSSNLPAGAVPSPLLPLSGNPVCTTITWTPTNAQVGSTVIHFTAADNHLRSSNCSVTVLVAECHLAIAAGTGNTPVTIFGHLYDTQLHGIRQTYPVTMTDMPSFLLPANGTGVYVQVLMYNPVIFPNNPSQWSKPMKVTLAPNGTLTTEYSGNSNGIGVRAMMFVDSSGQTRIRFPFRIRGL